MRRKLSLGRCLLCLLVLMGSFAGAAAPPAEGAAYYVAPNGSDANSGLSLSTPFRTIQKCANVAVAGDTCLVRGGVYRETVTVPRSGAAGAPITFRAYNGESATISGADVVSGWALDSGSVYRAPMGWSLKVRTTTPYWQITDDQVFVNGVMMPEARWPNVALDRVTRPSSADRARASGATWINTYSATLTDPALNGFPADYWKGGKITFAPGYGTINSTCDVTASAAGSVTLTCNPDPASGNYRTQWALPPGDATYRPHAGNSYYLWGKRSALDAPGEWFREGPSTGGTLYLRMPDGSSPAAAKVEARRRLWAFDLYNRGYITIDGLKLFAATLRTGDYGYFAHHITVHTVEARYLWHFQQVPPSWHEDGTHGLDFGGTDNVVRDSYLAFSAGPLLRLYGSRNRAENNVLRDGSYMGSAPMVSGRFSNLGSPGGADRNVLTGNTLFNSGQVLIHASAGFDILYNDAYNSHLQIMDLGTVYAQGTDGKQAQIAYNTVHDNRAELSPALTFWGGFGIYLDDGTSNYVVHHNAVWNVTADGLVAQGGLTGSFPSGTSRRFYNNTVDGSIAAYKKSGTTLRGTEFRNNYATENLATDPELALQANRFDAQLAVKAPGQDYTLRPGSPAIDAGVALPPYTDGYAGAAPDVGSYEYGATTFVSGAALRPGDLAGLSVSCSMRTATTAACTVRNLPVGRRLPSGFAVRVGPSGAPATACWTVMDYGTHAGTGTCDPVSTAGLSGVQTVYVRLASSAWQATPATLDLGSGGAGLALDSVSPGAVPTGGGVTLTLRGRGFDTGEVGYLQPVTVTNSSGLVLANYQTLVTLDTAALIAQGRLRSDCGDLRFGDATGSLPYWLEDGCNTTKTRVWVKAAVLPNGEGRFDLTYGAPGRGSAGSGPQTFQFFDSFGDGQIDAAHWIAGSSDWYTVAERNGGLCISGTTNAGNQYNAAYMKLKLSSIVLPATFAIDSELALNQSPARFKAAVGTDDLMIYGGAAGAAKSIGYYLNGWQKVGTSTIATGSPLRPKFTVAYTGAEGARTVRWLENGNGGDVRATRSTPDQASGDFAFGPDAVATVDACFDNVRLRSYVYPEPAVRLGPAVPTGVRVTVGGAACTAVAVPAADRLTCVAPAHSAGPAAVTVTNPDGQAASLAGAVVYTGTMAATPAASPVYLPMIANNEDSQR